MSPTWWKSIPLPQMTFRGDAATSGAFSQSWNEVVKQYRRCAKNVGAGYDIRSKHPLRRFDLRRDRMRLGDLLLRSDRIAHQCLRAAALRGEEEAIARQRRLRLPNAYGESRRKSTYRAHTGHWPRSGYKTGPCRITNLRPMITPTAALGKDRNFQVMVALRSVFSVGHRTDDVVSRAAPLGSAMDNK
jgi:hypothetical protein